ncbi:MAG: porin family protein [Bacteroidia bacterium]
MTPLHVKKGIALLAMAFIAFNAAQAQEKEETETPDTTKKKETVESFTIPVEGGKIEIKFYEIEDTTSKETKPKKVEPRKFWSGFDFGFNGYMTASGVTTMPMGSEGFDINQGKSLYMGFNFYELGIPIYKHNVVLLTGLGIDYNNYRFKNNYSPFGTPDSSGAYVTRDYEQNRLKTFYATMPLMLGLDFSKPGKKGFHVAAGVVGGVRIGSYTKEKYNEGGDVIKTNTRGEHDLNPFRLSAQARVGYGDFTVFASYSLTEMFRENAGKPQVYPFNFGISFGG